MFLQLLSVLHGAAEHARKKKKKALGFCSEMNAAVLSCLMSQLMVLSRLIRAAPIVSVGSVSRLSTTGEGPLLPPGCGGPGAPPASV